jgi:ABC-type transport system involved in multi-copper enzyme maturation permease subunit
MQAFFTALFGPVFTKEMLELARRRRYHFLRAAYGLAIFFVLFTTFQSYDWQLRQPSGDNIRFMAEFAETIFRSVGITQFVALFALVPMFLSGTIASEREEHTLDLLFTTTLLDREIVVGKMLSRLVIFALLIMMALPIFSLMTLFGGISPPALFRFAAALLTALVYAGAYSIYYSTITKSPMGALLRTYWQLALRLLLFPYLLMVLGFALGRAPTLQLGPYVLGFLCCTNPLAPLMMLMAPMLYEGAAAEAARFGPFIGRWFFPLLLVIPWLRAAQLTRRAVYRLRVAPIVRPSRWRRVVPFRQAHRVTDAGSRMRKGAPRSAPERWFGSIPVRNPLWLRARQCYCFDREGHLGRLQVWAWIVAALFLVLIAIGGAVNGERVFRGPEIALAFLPVTYVTLAMFITIVASTSIVGDRRRGFLDILLTTPLTSREFVDGTFMSVWAHLKRLSWLPLALAGLFLLTRAVKLPELAMSLAITGAYLVALVLVGIGCSLCARSVAGTLVPAFLFLLVPNLGIVFFIQVFMRYAPFALCFVSVTGLFVTAAWVRRQTTSASVGCYLLSVFQCLVTGAVMLLAWRDTPRGQELIAASMPSFQSFFALDPRTPVDRLPHAHWIRPCFLTGIIVFCIWARWWLIAHFDTLAGRASSSTRRPGSIVAGITSVIYFFYWHIPEALRPRWRKRDKGVAVDAEPVLSDKV